MNKADLLEILKAHFSQSPITGYTDYPFRKIIRKYGCRGLIFTEMVSGKGYLMNPKHHEEILRFDEEDRPIGIQIFGGDPESIASTAEAVEEKYSPDVIDINMGCPARKVTNKFGGAALLQHPDIAEKIINAAVKRVKTPLTIKTRIGWSFGDLLSKPLLKLAEDNGLLCAFLHLRSKTSLFSGRLEYDNFRKLKDGFKIPLIANGGIYSKEDFLKTVDEIQPDGIMIGMGSAGNPWIFNIKDTDYKAPVISEKLSVLKEHLLLTIEYFGETSGIHKFRKFYKPYLTGIPNHTKILPELFKAKNINEVLDILNMNFVF
ncbi:MAG: tRNA-dihydrouridine synthase [bacterium]|nr:tRNA-dihydrouridine synthase [bacterium]